MVGQPLALVEADVAGLVEGDLVHRRRARSRPVSRMSGDHDVGRVGIDAVGTLARPGRAGRRGRWRGPCRSAPAIRRGRPRRASVRASSRLVAQPLDKAARGRHRSHRVRAGRTDADLEQVEDAADQIVSPEPRKWAAKRSRWQAERALRPARRRPSRRPGLAVSPSRCEIDRDPRSGRGSRLPRTAARRGTPPASSLMRPAMRWRRSSRRWRRRPAGRAAFALVRAVRARRGGRRRTPSCPIPPAPGRAGRGRWSAEADI